MCLSAFSLPALTYAAMDAALPAGKVFGSSHVEELMGLFLDPRDKSDVIARAMGRATVAPNRTAQRGYIRLCPIVARRARQPRVQPCRAFVERCALTIIARGVQHCNATTMAGADPSLALRHIRRE